MPEDKEIRLGRLRGLGILDTPSEERFDRITRLAAELLGTPIALVPLVDAERQWFKSRVGLLDTETPLSASFCAHAIEEGPGNVMVVEDASLDTRFADNPLVTGKPGIRFYAGATLATRDGINLGTLCVIDDRPRPRPSDRDLRQLRELAAIVVDEMELSKALRDSDRRLALLKLSEAMSGVGFWRFDTISTEVIWSDQVYAIYGLNPENFSPDLERVLASFHPDDRPILEGYIQRALERGEGYAFELRMQRSDGEWRRVTAKAVAETDAAGRTIALNGVFQDITDQVRAREATAESEARYRLLADASSDVVLRITVDARIDYASPSIRQFGWKPEELVGKPVAEFIHQADVERVRTTMAAVLAGDTGEISKEQEFRVRTIDGRFVWVEVRRTLVRGDDGAVRFLVSQIRDVSERHETTMKLAESEARYRMLADNTTDIIGRVSLDGIIRYVSPAIYRLTGHQPEEMVGHRSRLFTHPDDVAHVVAAFRERMAGSLTVKPVRYRIRHKQSGEWIWVEANPRLAIGPSGAPEFIDVMRDVRDQVALEASMLLAKTDAEAGSRAKADFLANMSHEIRTPLNGIVGYAAVLSASPELPAKLRRYADIVTSSSRALIRIVDDVLDLSALDTNEVGFDIHAFELTELVEATVATFQLRVQTKGLALHVFVDPRLSAFQGDQARIQQVLTNIIGNAVKFTASGAIEIRFEPVRDGSDQTLRCTVRDSGIGIPADRLDGLFSRFNQADTTINRRFGGSGLGLAISKQIVTAMGGSIGVDSVAGVGSTFWFTLPLRSADARDVTEGARQSIGTSSVRGKLILLVDDHDINRELGAVLLTPLGHKVILAANGADALKLVQENDFDLIFMDVQMPGTNGFEATRAIRELESGRSVPIVALTAHAMRHQIDECLRSGMDGHVSKPFSAESLQTAILKWANQPPVDARPRAPLTTSAAEILALRDRFVLRCADDLEELLRLRTDPALDAQARLQTLIHRLAGTAGSLGFDAVGSVALMIDASMTRGEPLTDKKVKELIDALSGLKDTRT